MIKSNYIQSVINFFSTMDITNLRLHLKDEYNYEDTTKEIFLNEIERIFDAHKNSGDSELLIYKGACAGKKCGNCGMKGYRFVGNHSKNYMDLVFEIDSDDIKDIISCSYFKPDVEIDALGSKATIYFKEDDRISFNRTPDYWFKVYSASAAYNEIITKPPGRINFEELSYWVDKHSVTDELIGSFDIFTSQMRWTPFSMLYDELKNLRDYISRYIHDIKQANYAKSLLKNEQELIDWIFANEALHEAVPFDFRYFHVKQGENYLLYRQNQILVYGERFDETFDFDCFYQENYDNLFEKYTIYTTEEEQEILIKMEYRRECDSIFSLKFHLENRKLLEELGISIPLYINKDIPPL